ncbi:MAG: anti-sigma factor, partial [Pseudonocardiaceae bacterium]
VCSDEVARLRPAVDALPRSVTPVNPPPALKASIMKVVEAEARERALGPEAARRPRPLTALRHGLGEAFSGMRPTTVAWVSASFLLLAGIVGGIAATQIGSGEDGTEALAAKVDKMRVPSASGSLTVSGNDSKESGILRVHGMPALKDDSTYQVWVRRNGEIIPSSLFSVGQDGDGAAAIPENLDGADAVMVTRERAGGARAPSEDPILSVTL